MNTDVFDLLFDEARTYSYWQKKSVQDSVIREIYDLCKMGPTSANCQPIRIVFIKTPEAKEQLRPCLLPGNIDKTMTAPVTAIFAYDMEFYNQLPITFPHVDARPWFTQTPEDIMNHAFRNATLQAAYFMIAARAKGLDCGPMSGFNAEMVDALFLKGTTYRSNFLCNLGYGDKTKEYGRLPRLSFEDTCFFC